jgi:ATP-dependent Clp protease ATP-binding subunit ClpC
VTRLVLMFERFTDRARRVVVLAQEEARQHGYVIIDGGHLVLGILHEGECTAAKILHDYGLTLEGVRDELYPERGGEAPSGHLPWSGPGKKALELSLREALQLGHNYVGPEHLLLGLLRDGSQSEFFEPHGIELADVRRAVIEMVTPPKPETTHVQDLLTKELAILDKEITDCTALLTKLKASRAEVADHLAKTKDVRAS